MRIKENKGHFTNFPTAKKKNLEARKTKQKPEASNETVEERGNILASQHGQALCLEGAKSEVKE